MLVHTELTPLQIPDAQSALTAQPSPTAPRQTEAAHAPLAQSVPWEHEDPCGDPPAALHWPVSKLQPLAHSASTAQQPPAPCGAWQVDTFEKQVVLFVQKSPALHAVSPGWPQGAPTLPGNVGFLEPLNEIVRRVCSPNPAGAVATRAKLPVFTPSRNCPEMNPFWSVKPHALVGSTIVATRGFSNAKQICTPGSGLPLPSTSFARNPERVRPSAFTAFGTLSVKQLPPPFGPAGEQDWLTNCKNASNGLTPPPVPPQEEYPAITATPAANSDDQRTTR